MLSAADHLPAHIAHSIWQSSGAAGGGTGASFRSRYTAEVYRLALARYRITPSMSDKGNCLDNAPMKSFFHTLNTERVKHRVYPTLAKARLTALCRPATSATPTFYSAQQHAPLLDIEIPL